MRRKQLKIELKTIDRRDTSENTFERVQKAWAQKHLQKDVNFLTLQQQRRSELKQLAHECDMQLDGRRKKYPLVT